MDRHKEQFDRWLKTENLKKNNIIITDDSFNEIFNELKYGTGRCCYITATVMF